MHDASARSGWVGKAVCLGGVASYITAEQSIAKKTYANNNEIIINNKNNVKIIKPKQEEENIKIEKKIIKWAPPNNLISVKMFLFDDPPNAPPVTIEDLEELSKK
jgi:hypothetical protein